MRQIDSMTDKEIEVLQLKGMLSMNTPTKTQPTEHTPAEQFLHNELLLAVRDAGNIRNSQKRAIERIFQQRDELLKACQMMLALDGGDIAKDYREEFDSLKAAIAKAEGRA